MGCPRSSGLRTMHADTRPQSCNDGPTPMEIDDEEEKLEEKVEKAKEVEEYSDSFRCIICLNPWEREGPHRTCCLPCGHLYGLSCIQNCINLAAKCPQCNVRCNLNEVIKLFALPTILLDQNLQKENENLKDENRVLMSHLQSAKSRIPSPCQASGSGQTSPCQASCSGDRKSQRKIVKGLKTMPANTRPQSRDAVPAPMEIGDEEEILEQKVEKAKEDSERTAKEVEYLDSFHCVICTNPWEREGWHLPSCLPCGHLYGLSCITQWIMGKAVARKAASCPQCNVRCNLKDLTRLFALPAILLDQIFEKENKALKAENCNLVSQLLSAKSGTLSPCQGFW